MMEAVLRVDGEGACPVKGRVRLDAPKALWMMFMVSGSIMAPFFITWPAVLLFFGLSYFTLLFGHSIGLHRMMIHRSFKAPLAVNRVLIFIGVLVGMGGPRAIINVHDSRDWAQRQPICHDFFAHRRGYIRDIFWQLFCRFDYNHPPKIMIEDEVLNDPYLRFFDRHWRGLQCTLAVIFFMIGGLPWVLWGVCLRVFVSIWGHWTVTYICHNPGAGRWHVIGAGVQAANLSTPGALWVGFITHGECWHNNHHAFPESAQIGLQKGQIDPAWWIICGLEKIGWAYDVGRPRPEGLREDLTLRL